MHFLTNVRCNKKLTCPGSFGETIMHDYKLCKIMCAQIVGQCCTTSFAPRPLHHVLCTTSFAPRLLHHVLCTTSKIKTNQSKTNKPKPNQMKPNQAKLNLANAPGHVIILLCDILWYLTLSYAILCYLMLQYHMLSNVISCYEKLSYAKSWYLNLP